MEILGKGPCQTDSIPGGPAPGNAPATSYTLYRPWRRQEFSRDAYVACGEVNYDISTGSHLLSVSKARDAWPS